MNKENPKFLSEKEATALEIYSPNNPPWNNAMAFLLWFVSVLLIFILPALFVAPYIFTQFKDFSDQQALAKFATTDVTAIFNSDYSNNSCSYSNPSLSLVYSYKK